MRGNWIVDQGPDPALFKMSLQSIPVGISDHKHVPDVLRIRGNLGQGKSGEILQVLEIILGDPPPASVPLIEVLQLHAQEGCLERIETGVMPPLLIKVLFTRAIIP